MEHDASGSLCTDAYGSYPQGASWHFVPLSAATTPYASPSAYSNVQYGYLHYHNSGLFCSDNWLEVWRAQLVYDFTAAQMARKPINATFTATFVGSDVYGAPDCVPSAVPLREENWPQNSAGPLFSSYIGVETSLGLDVNNSLAPTPMSFNGNQFSVNFGAFPGNFIDVGFMAPNDGFASQNPAEGGQTSFAHDNNKCLQALTNAQMTLTYTELPPDTPTGCTQSVDCATVTFTCNSAPEYFTLVYTDVYGDVYTDVGAQGSAAGTVSLPAVVSGDLPGLRIDQRGRRREVVHDALRFRDADGVPSAAERRWPRRPAGSDHAAPDVSWASAPA